MHHDELRVDPAVARELIAMQFPQLADLPVKPVASPATMNAIFRVGDAYVARFPLRRNAPETSRSALARDMLAVQEFHDLELIPSPKPIGIGDPGLGYPMSWTLQTWVPGTDGLTEDPADSSASRWSSRV
jgi:aminoglycoside phosphotransferase (APT) family kinase protein